MSDFASSGTACDPGVGTANASANGSGRPRGALHGVLVVDKAAGMTSHDVVARIRRIARQREVGHAGTLDPMATGVLVVLLGEATKLTPWLTASDKRYEAKVAFGRATDSGDADGTPTSDEPIPIALRRELEGVLVHPTPLLDAAARSERDRAEQVPPGISAVHVEGERAYARVRRGEVVVLASRPVTVHALSVDRADPLAATLACALHVSKGYYVRAFARDFAASLGTVAHLSALRRMASGAFLLTDAVQLPSLDAAGLEASLIPCGAAAARALPTLALGVEEVRLARQGKRFPWPIEDNVGAHAWLSPEGELVAVGEAREGAACVIRGFFGAGSQAR